MARTHTYAHTHNTHARVSLPGKSEYISPKGEVQSSCIRDEARTLEYRLAANAAAHHGSSDEIQKLTRTLTRALTRRVQTK